MKFRQTDAPSVAAAKASISAATAYRFEHDHRLPSDHQQTRGRRRPDPLADFFETEIVPMLKAAPELRAGDDPTGPREASGRMRVFLPFGVSFQGRDQRFKGFNLRFREDGRGRQLVPAVTFLHQLHIDTRGFYRRACPCEGGGR